VVTAFDAVSLTRACCHFQAIALRPRLSRKHHLVRRPSRTGSYITVRDSTVTASTRSLFLPQDALCPKECVFCDEHVAGALTQVVGSSCVSQLQLNSDLASYNYLGVAASSFLQHERVAPSPSVAQDNFVCETTRFGRFFAR
jgi:hypothetical protein